MENEARSQWRTRGATDWAGAQWIAARPDLAVPQLRREFALDRPIARALLHVCGLGVSRIKVNGRLPGEVLLDPPPTAYHRRVLYRTHDVTSLLTEGANTLAVILAPGWYGMAPAETLYWKDAPWLGTPKLLLKLVAEHPDGGFTEVVSDDSWRVSGGAVTAAAVFAGEIHDLRLATPGWELPGFADGGWEAARAAEPPAGVVEPAGIEPIRVTGTAGPAQVTQLRSGTWVYRFPEMVVGWARLRVRGEARTQVTVRYGERLHEDGTVDVTGDPGLTVGDIQTDVFTLSGAGEEVLEPYFTYKGFQFVQVDGVEPDSVEALLAHTDVASAGEFSCSDPLVNRLHTMARRSILHNLHGFPEDTPVFEKRGWLGDGQLTAETAMDNFGMREVYAKWLRDIADSQDANGNVSATAPNPTTGDCPDPAWGAAYVLIPWLTYWRYGDTALLAEHFDGMRRYVGYLTAKAEDELIPPALFGDWVPPGYGACGSGVDVDKFFPPEGPELCAAAYYHRAITVLSWAATALDSDPSEYTELADRVKQAFNARFLADGVYGTGKGGYRQTSNVLPLAFGLVPGGQTAEVVSHLVADIAARGDHLDTGILGTKELLPVLTDHGQVDLAYRVFTQRTAPGFGHWVEQGATTLWEAWQQPRSRAHHMYGSYGDWLFTYLAGIRVTAPGYAEVWIQPHVPSALTHARAAVDTVRGRIVSGWQVTEDGGLVLDLTVPPDVRAKLAMPGRTPWVVPPGSHRFELSWAEEPK